MTLDLAVRNDGIGASEIGAILGVSPYRNADDVFLLKTGQAPEFDGNQYTEWGHRLEPVIVAWYCDTWGGDAHPSPTLFSPTEKFAFCTPDRIVYRKDEVHGLECKNKSYSQRAKWADGPTPDVLAQVKWSMMVTQFPYWDIAVLFGGNDARVYRVDRDDDWEIDALHRASQFWDRVVQANLELWG